MSRLPSLARVTSGGTKDEQAFTSRTGQAPGALTPLDDALGPTGRNRGQNGYQCAPVRRASLRVCPKAAGEYARSVTLPAPSSGSSPL